MAYVKKLIGLLAAAGIIAVLVFTVLNRDTYRSMVFDDGVSLFGIFGSSAPAGGTVTDPVADAPVFESPEDFIPDAEYDEGSEEWSE